jgi:hypothetical protein
MTHSYTKLMHDIDARYQASSGLTDRRYYSIFYGPLAPFPIAVINENPGGTPEDYQVVDVDAGQHEYVEGRFSGNTTLNGADLLRRLLDVPDFEPIRQFQVFNRFFRRSPNSGGFSASQKRAFAAEAQPFLLECLKIVTPRLLIFGGANAAVAFMKGLGGKAVPDDRSIVRGPNGANEAVYYLEYQLSHPQLGEMLGVGIYHPSKLNGVFYKTAFPRLAMRAQQALSE